MSHEGTPDSVAFSSWVEAGTASRREADEHIFNALRKPPTKDMNMALSCLDPAFADLVFHHNDKLVLTVDDIRRLPSQLEAIQVGLGRLGVPLELPCSQASEGITLLRLSSTEHVEIQVTGLAEDQTKLAEIALKVKGGGNVDAWGFRVLQGTVEARLALFTQLFSLIRQSSES